MAKPKSKILRGLQVLASLIALIVIFILFLYVKNRIEGKLNIWQVKIPRNETELKQVSEGIVAGVARSATEGGIRDTVDKSKVFFEESDIASPARSIRDDAKNTVQNLLERLKTLPADEFNLIKQKLYEVILKDNLKNNYGRN